MKYHIVMVVDSNGEPLGLFHLETSLGRVVMIVEHGAALGAVTTYAGIVSARQGNRVAVVTLDAESAGNAAGMLREAEPAWAESVSFVTEQDQIFQDLLDELRASTAAGP